MVLSVSFSLVKKITFVLLCSAGLMKRKQLADIIVSFLPHLTKGCVSTRYW